MSLSQLTIIGAGLIGGSIALAARERGCASRIVAIDRMERPGGKWEEVFDDWISTDPRGPFTECLLKSTLTIICVPVRGIVELLPSILEATSGVVTDCGSTKQAISSSVSTHPASERFVAGHPMAGHPDGGLQNARADLFEGRKWILCPQGSRTEALQVVSDLVRALGALPLELSAQEHDHGVAITSHVPQVVASALSVQAFRNQALRVAGPGFASATRVAGGAEAIWRDIFDTNGEAVGEALREVGLRLQQLGDELRQGSSEGTLTILEQARELRDT